MRDSYKNMVRAYRASDTSVLLRGKGDLRDFCMRQCETNKCYGPPCNVFVSFLIYSKLS